AWWPGPRSRPDPREDADLLRLDAARHLLLRIPGSDRRGDRRGRLRRLLRDSAGAPDRAALRDQRWHGTSGCQLFDGRWPFAYRRSRLGNDLRGHGRPDPQTPRARGDPRQAADQPGGMSENMNSPLFRTSFAIPQPNAAITAQPVCPSTLPLV